MWTRSYSKIYQNISKEAVWQLLGDVNNWPKWHTDLEYCKMKGEFVVGNHFMLKPKKAPVAKVEIIEVEVGKQFTDCTKFLGAKMYNTHMLEEVKGSLRMSHKIVVIGPLKWLWIMLVAKNIAAIIPDDIDALVKLTKHN